MKTRVAFILALLFYLHGTILAQQPKKTMQAVGRVTAVAQDSITVKPGATTLTFAVDASTTVTGKGVGTKTRALKAEGKSPMITDLVDEYDSVTVEYHDLGDGKLQATRVKINVKSFKKR